MVPGLGGTTRGAPCSRCHLQMEGGMQTGTQNKCVDHVRSGEERGGKQPFTRISELKGDDKEQSEPNPAGGTCLLP